MRRAHDRSQCPEKVVTIANMDDAPVEHRAALLALTAEIAALALQANDAESLLNAACHACNANAAISGMHAALFEGGRVRVIGEAHRAPGHRHKPDATRDWAALAQELIAGQPSSRARGSGGETPFALEVGRSAIGALLFATATPAPTAAELETFSRIAAMLSHALTRLDKEARDELAVQHLQRRIEALEAEVSALRESSAEASVELESFAYSISHDLRAPIRHISGFANLLRDELGTTLSEQAAHHLSTVITAARRLGVLIDDLLAYSRAARHPLRARNLDPTPLVRNAIEELADATVGRNIEWKIHELPRVYADVGLVQLVLKQLLDNAVKFTRGREPARIEISAPDADEPFVTFDVSDNGVGFDMRYADKLFGVFQRLHREEEFEGSGIGLAISQRIVHRHGGRIWCQTASDRGAGFRFTLPAAKETR